LIDVDDATGLATTATALRQVFPATEPFARA